MLEIFLKELVIKTRKAKTFDLQSSEQEMKNKEETISKDNCTGKKNKSNNNYNKSK